MNLALSPMFKALDEALEGGDPATAAAAALALYDKAVAPYRPLVDVAEALAPKVAADIAPLAAGLVTLVVGLGQHPAFREAVDELEKTRAERRMSNLNAYVAAGFTREEAMRLVVADAGKGMPTPNLSGLRKSA